MSAWDWIVHFTGADNGSGRWYLWWSGFGANLGELTIIGGLVAVYRKNNCEVHRCWRIGRHATEAGHHVCHKHSPLGRAPTHKEILESAKRNV